MLGTAIDSLVSVISPRWALSRIAHRAAITNIKAAASGRHEAMEKLLGSRRDGGYEAGKADRLKGYGTGSVHENDLPRVQIDRMRFRAWRLYRNNPQARKICRTLGAKVIGPGLSPQPQSTKADGSPYVEFRRRARQVWEEFVKEADYRGKPGRGGQHFDALSKTALRAAILSGGVLFRFRHLDRTEQVAQGLHVPLQVQLIHVDRLDQNAHGDGKFYGVELDAAGKPVAYYVVDAESATGSTRVPAAEMGNLFVEEDIDQILGTPWFGAVLPTADDRRGYEYSELVAAEMGACIVAGYRRSSGQQGGLGLPSPNANYDLTDADGNPITRLQPGMFLDLGATGEIQMVNPGRPNTGAEGFIQHMVRSEAVAVPGVKASTLTGDYRNSSFSSERSADNDVWPEIEEIQDWISCGFCQPIWEECITAAVTSGRFADVPEFDTKDFTARKRDYLKTNWQGPVPRSINPKDDADASRQRVKNLQSTPQIEAAMQGRDWRENVDAVAEFIDYCRERSVPDDIWQQALGIDQSDSPAPVDPAQPTEQQQDDAMDIANRLRNSGFVGLNSARSA